MTFFFSRRSIYMTHVKALEVRRLNSSSLILLSICFLPRRLDYKYISTSYILNYIYILYTGCYDPDTAFNYTILAACIYKFSIRQYREPINFRKKY